MSELENLDVDNSKEKLQMQQDSSISEEEDLEYSSSDEEDLVKDYFGEDEAESESEEAVWEDSESDEELLRMKHKNTPLWINDKQPKRQIEIKRKKLSYRFVRYIFKTNFNIKNMKRCMNFLVLVDTMNAMYILQDNKLIKSLKISNFRIDDIIGFNNKIYLINSRCGYLKEIDEDFQIDSIEKKLVRNMRKAFAGEYLYIMGDTTVALNRKLNCVAELHEKLISIEEYKSKIVAISQLGDVLVFSKELKLENKLVFDEGASFTSLYTSLDYLLINSSSSIIVLDENFRIVKDAPHLKNPVKNITFIAEHFFCFSSAKGGLKILTRNLHFNNSFPKKKIRLPDISIAISWDEGVYLSSHRDLHYLGIVYE